MKKTSSVEKYACKIRKKLNCAIEKTIKSGEEYLEDPSTDFSRKRDLSFDTVVKTILNFGSENLQSEINIMFPNEVAPTKSALCQQRNKIKPVYFMDVFKMFMSDFKATNTYKGYRLLAFDGSTINLPRNPKDIETTAKASPKAKSYNMLHLNANYDILNHVYTDFSFNFGMASYELEAMLNMADNIKNPQKSIIIADRGLGSLHSVVELNRKSIPFVLRAKDITSNGFLNDLNLPDTEFDISLSKIITYSRKKIYKNNPDYIIVDSRSAKYFNDEKTCPVSFRVVRFKISENGYESLVTNLPDSEFSVEELKYLYSLRWKIETSFLDLKYSCSLVYLHSKKLKFILQELIASIICYNACSMITQMIEVVKSEKAKYPHKVNFAAAVKTLKVFFFNNGKTVLLDRLYQDSVAVKPQKSSDRYLHDTKPAKPFKYR